MLGQLRVPIPPCGRRGHVALMSRKQRNRCVIFHAVARCTALLLFVQLFLASVGPFCCSSALPQKCEHMKLHGGGVLALPALAVACHSGSELETTSFTPGITEHTANFKRVSPGGKVRLIRACDMISPSQIFDISFRSRNYRSLCWSSMIFFFTPMRTF